MTIPAGGYPGLPFVPGFQGATEVLISTDDPRIGSFIVTAVSEDGRQLMQIVDVHQGFASAVFDSPNLKSTPKVSPLHMRHVADR